MKILHEELFKKVLPVLQSKLEEIKYFEYDGITTQDIWNYCLKKKWKKQSIDKLPLYGVIETIYSIKASEIVSFAQIQQFKSTNWFSEVNQDELKELLNPKVQIKE
ncbi:post-transcriptional regulator [Ureibacillus composti]